MKKINVQKTCDYAQVTRHAVIGVIRILGVINFEVSSWFHVSIQDIVQIGVMMGVDYVAYLEEVEVGKGLIGFEDFVVRFVLRILFLASFTVNVIIFVIMNSLDDFICFSFTVLICIFHILKVCFYKTIIFNWVLC